MAAGRAVSWWDSVPEDIVAFPSNPDVRPLPVPEVFASLVLATMPSRAKCTAAPVDGVNDFVANTVWVGMDRLYARGVVVPYRAPEGPDTEAVAWDMKTIEMLTEQALADMLRTGLVRGLAEDDSQ